MDWITDQIAIGNFKDALEKCSKVDAVLCLREDCCEERDDIDAFCYPLVDGPGNRQEDIEEAIQTIADIVGDGEKILVHCHAGRSRSVCVVAAYFVKFHGMLPHQAISFIASKRDIQLTPGIEDIFTLLK